jgi:hypothetical protein
MRWQPDTPAFGALYGLLAIGAALAFVGVFMWLGRWAAVAALGHLVFLFAIAEMIAFRIHSRTER